jgi:hypothetical protein
MTQSLDNCELVSVVNRDVRRSGRVILRRLEEYPASLRLPFKLEVFVFFHGFQAFQLVNASYEETESILTDPIA